MIYNATVGQGVHFKIVGKAADNSIGDLQGSTPGVINDRPDILTASIEPAGLLRIVPTGIGGTATVTVTSLIGGSYVNGILTVVVAAPAVVDPVGLSPAVTLTFEFVDSFAV